MSINIRSVIVNGLEDIWNTQSTILAIAFTISYLILDAGADTLLAHTEPTTQTNMALGSNLFTASILLSSAAILSILLVIITVRFYTSTNLNIEPSMYRENLLLPALNIVIGSIIFTIIVSIGLILLIIPGLFLMTALYFYTFRIIIENENFIEAFKSSYNLTSGHRIKLFVLGALIIIPIQIITIISFQLLLADIMSLNIPVLVANTLYNFIISLTILAILSIGAQTYIQLTD